MQESGEAVITPSNYRNAKLALAFALALFASADCAYWERCTPQPRVIFSGITYGCELLERTEQGHGVVHWVALNSKLPEQSFTWPRLSPLLSSTAFSIDCAGSTTSCRMNALLSPSMGRCSLQSPAGDRDCQGISQKGSKPLFRTT